MLKPLTSLRFVFAFMVFLLHVCNSCIPLNATVAWIFDNIFKECYIGVGFFFMLSGFILAYNYKDKFLQNKITIKNFWIKRIARVYPVHLLTMGVSIWMFSLWNYNLSNIVKPFFLNLFLLQTYVIPVSKWYGPFNAVSWSVSDEMFFYFLCPFIIFLNKNKRTFTTILLIAIVAIPVLMFEPISKGLRTEYFYIHPFFRIVDFGIGILLHEIYLKIKNSNILRFSSSLEFLSLLLFILFFSFHNEIPQVYRYSCYYWIPISLIILIFSFQRGLISQFLSNRYFVYLGEISYSFYMFHALILRFFIDLNSKYIVFENYYVFLFFIFYFSLFISAICYRFFEQPLNKYIIKKFIAKD